MPMLEWNDNLSIRVAEIDAQHNGLVNMVNKLYDSMCLEATVQTLAEIISEMRNYAEIHFATEERYMEKFGYPEIGAHKTEHRDFVKKVTQVENDYKSGKIALSMDILNYLSNWLVTHISDTDKLMGAFLVQNGVA